jgi:hypothetical protein
VVLGCLGAATADFAPQAAAVAPGGDAFAPEAQTSTITDVTVLSELDPPYTGYPGTDYIPTSTPPLSVPVTDIEGVYVVDAVECAETCTDTPDCNAASYYGDNPPEAWPGAARLHTA